MQGWISLHRKILEHWLYKEKRVFNKFEAWIDLLLMVSHDENKFVFGNEVIKTTRGSLVTSELKLMERWTWSKTKTRAFLKVLEDDLMIVKKSDNKKTTITIVNYSIYQETQTEKELQKDFKKTSKKLQKDTINNVNKKEVSKNEIKTFDEIVNCYTTDEKLKETIYEYIKMRKQKNKTPTNRALELIFEDLDNLSFGNAETKVKILEKSIKEGWTGVFELKQQNKPQEKSCI